MRKGLKKTYHRILQKSPRLEDVHKEKKVREQDEENKKDGIQIRPEAVWSFPINTLLLVLDRAGKEVNWKKKYDVQIGPDARASGFRRKEGATIL